MADNDGRIHIVIDGDASELQRALSRVNSNLSNAEKNLGKFGKGVDASMRSAEGSVGVLEKSLGSLVGRFIGVTAAVAALKKVIGDTIRLNSEFEAKESELAAVLGTTKDRLGVLTKGAEDLGRTTIFTASNVVDLQIALARLGFTSQQISELQQPILQFAAAVGTDLGRASAFAGAALRAFGLEATDTKHLLDVMSAATNKSALDFSKLETSISIVAPVAHSFGLSVEDTVTLLGALSNAGFDASSAATATRNILLNLADANGKLAKGLGHTATTFSEIIDSLKECTERGIDLNSALEMTDRRSVAAFSALITGAESAHELRDALSSVDGTLDTMYETMTDNYVSAVKALQSAWEGLILKAQGATGPMAAALRSLANLINMITDNTKEVGKVLLELLVTFGIYKTTMKSVTLLTKGYTLAEQALILRLTAADKAQKILNATILKNPYALATAAVIALAFGIYKAVTATTAMERATKKLDDAEKDMNKNVASETAQIDALFARLKIAKKGTEEYAAAKNAIMSKYGNYLSKLGDEKTALNDIAAAYRLVSEEATRAARVRAMESFTSSAADDYGKTVSDTRAEVYKLLQKKYGDQTNALGMNLAEDYYWRIVPVIEGKEEITDEIEEIIVGFNRVNSYSAAFSGRTYSYTTNALRSAISNVQDARKVFEDVIADAERRFIDKPYQYTGPRPGDPDFIGPVRATGGKSGGNKDGGNNPLDDDAKKKIKQARDAYKESIENFYRQLRDKTIDEERRLAEAIVAGKEEGYAKEDEQARLNHIHRLEDIQREYNETIEVIKKSQRDYYKKLHEDSDKGFAIDKSDARFAKADEYRRKALSVEDDIFAKEQATRERERNEERMQNQWAYLQKYGTYKERELAITEEFDKKISKAQDDFAKRSLDREKEQALRDLEQEYNSTYSLIFARTESMSDSLLAKAIEATEDAIKNAKDSGDIQALTELYGRLREQMDLQVDRKRGWGWAGIAQGFKLRDAANDKRSLANTLERQLASREEGLDFLKASGVDEEKIEAARKKVAQLRAEIQKLRDDASNDDSNALGFLQKGFSEVGNAMSELGSAMSSFRDGLNGACDTIADIGEGLSAIGEQADSIQKAFSGTMTKGEAISTAVSGAIQLVSMVGQSIVANKKAQEEWNATIEAAAQKYRMLQMKALDYKQQNLFGVENPYKKAIDGAIQYGAAMEALNEQVGKLASGKVQTGTKKVVDWGNVGKGAAIGAGAGAAVGSIIPGIGTAIGAAIGGAIGLIAGAVSTKTVPIFESLSRQYGQLFNPDTYELSEKLLADYDKLDNATKKIVDNWDEIVKKAKEAEQQMRDNFSALSGDVGNQLADSLVAAFRNGELYKAVDDFHGKMTGTIESIMEQLVFSSTFGAMFDELEDRMMKSFGAGGDNDIVDDLIWMEREYQNKLGQYEEAMAQVQKSLRGLGYDAWESDQRTAQTRAALGASQDSVDESNARLTTIQGHTFELNENVREMRNQHTTLIATTAALLEHVQGIHSDTGDMRATLQEVRTLAATIKSNVGTIIDRGVKAL